MGAVLLAIVLVVGAVWIVPNLVGAPGTAHGAGSPNPSTVAAGDATSAVPSLLTPVPTPQLSLPPAAAGPSLTLPAGRTLGRTGAIADVGADGSLSLISTDGRTVVLAPPGDAAFGFPAWSPDGSHVAAIRDDTFGAAILVFDARRALAGAPVEPTLIFRSAGIAPFYSSWTPDGRQVSFLADEADALSLRIAPADGSAPLDGTGPGAKIRTGSPLYFDWIDNGHLLAHVGTGPGAFLGEIGLDGAPAGPTLASPGDFRSPIVSHEGSRLAYVRAAATGPAEVVVASPDGSSAHEMSVFGPAGLAFDPGGTTVAAIAPIATGSTYSIPIGPLRLLDAGTGAVRTLLDGNVVSFWWSPDGRTIAALRVQPVAAAPTGSAAAVPAPSAVESASPAGASPAPSATEVRLVFVDVATGRIRSQPIVNPGQVFIDQFLTYFDQYALSHRIWSPDSSSVLMPLADADGTTRMAALFANGDPAIRFDGSIAFWSP